MFDKVVLQQKGSGVPDRLQTKARVACMLVCGILVLTGAPQAPCWAAGASTDNIQTRLFDPRVWIHELEMRAEAGDASAARIVAEQYAKGELVPQNSARALTWFRAALQRGDLNALVPLGDLMRGAPGVAPDIEAAVGLYERARNEGMVKAWERLGDLYATAPTPWRDGSRAVAMYAQSKDVHAALKLGALFEEGRLVPKDEVAARRVYESALAALGNRYDTEGATVLRERLAVMREEGRGGPRNATQAALDYEDLATPLARFRLARLLDEGIWVRPNADAALQAYRAGAQALLAQVTDRWGVWLQSKRYHAPDFALTEHPYVLLAAAKGDGRAVFVRAWLGQESPIRPKADPRVTSWLQEAARAGEPLGFLSAAGSFDPGTWTLDALRRVASTHLASPTIPSPAYAEALRALDVDLAETDDPIASLWRGTDIGAVESLEQARVLVRQQQVRVERLRGLNPEAALMPPRVMNDEKLLLGSLSLWKGTLADDVSVRRRWLRVAADHGNRTGQTQLARSFEEDAPHDSEQAYAWYLLAAVPRDPIWAKRRDAIGLTLTADAAARAQEQALQAWKGVPGDHRRGR